MTKLLFDNESICGLETCLEKLNNFQEETNAKIGKLETYSANLEMEKDFQTPKYDLVCKWFSLRTVWNDTVDIEVKT